MNPLQFARYELQKYAAAMDISPKLTLSVDASAFDPTRFFRFDPKLDDAFTVSVHGGEGNICATNERALLMGVYHFLKMQGCRFLHPGKDGEFIPVTGTVRDGDETWYANTRHRGTEDYGCNGGIDGILAVIDWLPKVMMNTFFIEHTSHKSNMNFWYWYRKDPFRKRMDVSPEQHREWDTWIVEELQKCGIRLHSGGHGWTAMLMEGITELKSAPQIRFTNDNTPCKNPEILAQLNGKRQLLKGVPLNSNVCLSQKKVREMFVKHVYEYSQQHPEIDYLHIWLGDAFSNFCECDECRKRTPTDWYVMLLNEIDAEFTRRGSSQKLVFLVYFELLYPPVTERIQNEDRFTMLFCPYGRDFTVRYRDSVETWVEPKLNNQYTRADMNMDYYLAQLRRWKELFHGDSLAFDYTLYDSASQLDLTGLAQKPLVEDDCIYMKDLGLNGRIECGDTRFMSPTPLIWNTMAEALFYGKATTEEAFFADYFGAGEPVLRFLRRMQPVLPIDFMRCRRDRLTPEELAGIAPALEDLRAFRAELFAHTPRHPFHRQNCQFLQEYLNLYELILETVQHQAAGGNGLYLEQTLSTLRAMTFRMDAILPGTFSAKSAFTHLRNSLCRTAIDD